MRNNEDFVRFMRGVLLFLNEKESKNMKKKNYKEMAKQILEQIGKKENILNCMHCITRLRLTVRDKSLVNEEIVRNIPGVIGTQWSGEQFQVVIGQDVNTLYEVICEEINIPQEKMIDELLDKEMVRKRFSFKNVVDAMLSAINGCIVPILPVFMLGGYLKLIVAVVGPSMLGLLPETNDFIRIITMAGDACYAFLPVFVAYSSAKQFKTNVPIALMLSCLMMSPELMKIVTAEEAFTVYGIPMKLVDYTYSFLPVLLNVWVLSKVEAFFKKRLPGIFKEIFSTICTMLVMLPIALCILGPIGEIGGEMINGLISWLYGVAGPFATALVAALMPFLVVTGMHHALLAVAYAQFAMNGVDSMILAATWLMDYQVLPICFAQLIKSKKSEDKVRAVECIVAEGIAGIGEPTLFGILLKSKKNMLYTFLGGLAGGLYLGITNTKFYVMAPVGFWGVLGYAGGSTANFINACVACVIAFVIPFALALIFGMEDKKVNVN